MINFGLSYLATAHICKVGCQQSLQGMSLSLPSMLILLPGWLLNVLVCPVFAVMKDPFLGFARVSPMSARLTEAAVPASLRVQFHGRVRRPRTLDTACSISQIAENGISVC